MISLSVMALAGTVNLCVMDTSVEDGTMDVQRVTAEPRRAWWDDPLGSLSVVSPESPRRVGSYLGLFLAIMIGATWLFSKNPSAQVDWAMIGIAGWALFAANIGLTPSNGGDYRLPLQFRGRNLLRVAQVFEALCYVGVFLSLNSLQGPNLMLMSMGLLMVGSAVGLCQKVYKTRLSRQVMNAEFALGTNVEEVAGTWRTR